MQGYWFNSNYGFFSPQGTAKFNKKYVGFKIEYEEILYSNDYDLWDYLPAESILFGNNFVYWQPDTTKTKIMYGNNYRYWKTDINVKKVTYGTQYMFGGF